MKRIRWTAGPDGIAHAHVSGRPACRVPAVAERFAWPTSTRCPACVAVVEVPRVQRKATTEVPA
jgi:hypothetical protein